MNIARMKLLNEVLSKLKPEQLDMADWYSCESVCCAAGWLARDPRAQAEGLHLVPTIPAIVPEYGDYQGYEAMAEYLEIGLYNAYWLFSPRHYRGDATLSKVRRRVRAMLRRAQR